MQLRDDSFINNHQLNDHAFHKKEYTVVVVARPSKIVDDLGLATEVVSLSI